MLEFYSFDNFDKFLVLPILGGFMLLVNALVYQGLVPPMSKLRHEQATDPGDSPKKEVVLVEERDLDADAADAAKGKVGYLSFLLLPSGSSTTVVVNTTASVARRCLWQ